MLWCGVDSASWVFICHNPLAYLFATHSCFPLLASSDQRPSAQIYSPPNCPRPQLLSKMSSMYWHPWPSSPRPTAPSWGIYSWASQFSEKALQQSCLDSWLSWLISYSVAYQLSKSIPGLAQTVLGWSFLHTLAVLTSHCVRVKGCEYLLEKVAYDFLPFTCCRPCSLISMAANWPCRTPNSHFVSSVVPEVETSNYFPSNCRVLCTATLCTLGCWPLFSFFWAAAASRSEHLQRPSYHGALILTAPLAWNIHSQNTCTASSGFWWPLLRGSWSLFFFFI